VVPVFEFTIQIAEYAARVVACAEETAAARSNLSSALAILAGTEEDEEANAILYDSLEVWQVCKFQRVHVQNN
jgi:hypothetical protein